MDAPVLITDRFWDDDEPVFMGGFDGELPEIDALRGQVLFKTSGSTGAPKWVALSRRALQVSAQAVNAHLEVAGDACWGLALPLHHVGGFGVMARANQAGCGLAVFTQRWQAADFTNWLEQQGVTHSALVPTQVHDLVAAGLSSPNSLRAVVVGGGQLAPSLGQAARDLGWPVLASFGMTEAGSQIATQGLECLANSYQAAPMPVLPHWHVALSAQGCLQISGEALFSGMLLQDGPSWTYHKRAGDWYETRDRVELDRGMLWPLGRADLQVKVLGELVSLEAIEGRIVELSAGSIPTNALVIVALADERAEHVLVPVFDGAVDRDQVVAVLVAYAAEAPGYARLVEPVLLDDFPRSPLGKPLRRECLETAATVYKKRPPREE